MSYQSYPYCCGVGCSYNFELSPTGTEAERDSFRSIVTQDEATARRWSAGMITLVLSDDQKPSFESVLLDELGFKLVSQTPNPYHDNETEVFLYVKIL